MKYDIELCMKVSEKQWIESLRNGTVCFNPIEVFIKKAEKNGNNEQGDRYEGIFARLHTSDRRVGELKIRFGDDLEIIPDNNYVLLRRKSSRKIPIFCMYGVRRDESDLQEDSVHKENGKYIGTVVYNFPPKIYNGFLDSSDVWGFYASSGHFFAALEKALAANHLTYGKAVINYDIELNKEFYFEPTENYSELIHKRKELEYQHEIRYILPFSPRDEKYLLKYAPLAENSCGIAPGALKLEMRCICKPLED